MQCKKIYLRLQDKCYLQYICDNNMTSEKKEKSKVTYPGFRHQTAIQVRFKDVDRMGHVNNANHLTYLEIARMCYFKDVVTEHNDWIKSGFILARITIDYIYPVMLDDEVSVFTRCSKTGKKSFDLEYEIVKRERDAFILLAKSTSVLVCYSYDLKQSISLDPLWIKKIKAYESA
jgi:acyl-CoA thioester hydrolase